MGMQKSGSCDEKIIAREEDPTKGCHKESFDVISLKL